MDKDLLAQNIEKAIHSKGLSKIKTCIDAGVGKDLIQNIRLGKKTELWRIVALAAYLGVTTSDLVGDSRASPPGAPIAELYNQLNEEGQEILMDYAEHLVATKKYTERGPLSVDTEAANE